MNSLIVFQRTDGLPQADTRERIGTLLLSMLGKTVAVTSVSDSSEQLAFTLTLYSTYRKVVTVALSVLLFPLICVGTAVGYITIRCSQSYKHTLQLYTRKEQELKKLTQQLDKWVESVQQGCWKSYLADGHLLTQNVVVAQESISQSPSDSLISRRLYGPERAKTRILQNFKTQDRSLDLHDLELAELPREISQLTHLQKLDLSYNSELREIPDEIGQLKNLRSLNLSHTSIQQLPDTINELKNLRSLNLSHTSIQQLPDTINELTNLEELDLHNSAIESLPNTIYNWNKLSKLDIEGTPCANSGLTRVGHRAQRVRHIGSQLQSWVNASPSPEEKVCRQTAQELICNAFRTQAKTLDLSNLRLTELPDMIDQLASHVTTLKLTKTHIRQLPAWIAKFSNLQELDLEGTQITALPASIRGLAVLERLNLSNTPLQKWPESTFRHLNYLNLEGTQLTHFPIDMSRLKQLQYLNLKNTHIQKLPESIKDCTKLRYINLAGSKINALPTDMSRLKRLQYLNFEKTHIEEVPESIGDCIHLQFLNLAENKISDLPKSMFKLKALKYLNLNNTHISDVPGWLKMCAHLHHLDVSNLTHLLPHQLLDMLDSISNLTELRTLRFCGYSQIMFCGDSQKYKQIPDKIAKIKTLRCLDLSNTSIEKLSNSISELKNLMVLKLSGNHQMQTLPDEIGYLENLEYLDISNGNIKLPMAISRCTNLKHLNICKNYAIKDLHDVQHLPKLKYLNIASTGIQENEIALNIQAKCKIRQLDDWVAHSPFSEERPSRERAKDLIIEAMRTKATTLDLSDLHLTELPVGIDVLNHLTHLNLQNNNIQKLPDQIAHLSQLEYLNLENTNIRHLPDGVRALGKLTTLNLKGTPIEELLGWIGQLTELQHLNLENTNIRHLPDEVRALGKLTTLTLKETPIKELPGWIGQLTELRHLNLEGTKIQHLPEAVGALNKLTMLNLKKTDIQQLPIGISTLSHIKHLDLERTKISTLPKKMGCYNTLTHINLKNTQVQELPQWLGLCTQLQHLNLEGTQITALSEQVRSCTKLTHLNLKNTQIQQLPEWLECLPNLEHLDIDTSRMTPFMSWILKMCEMRAVNTALTCWASDAPTPNENRTKAHQQIWQSFLDLWGFNTLSPLATSQNVRVDRNATVTEKHCPEYKIHVEKEVISIDVNKLSPPSDAHKSIEERLLLQQAQKRQLLQQQVMDNIWGLRRELLERYWTASEVAYKHAGENEKIFNTKNWLQQTCDSMPEIGTMLSELYSADSPDLNNIRSEDEKRWIAFLDLWTRPKAPSQKVVVNHDCVSCPGHLATTSQKTEAQNHVEASDSIRRTDLNGLQTNGLPQSFAQMRASKKRIATWHKIKTLSLANCGLTNIPTILTALVHIEVLNLTGNSLTGLPREFANWSSNLSKLDFSDNCLRKFEDIHIGLNNSTLKSLNLQNNHLSTLPKLHPRAHHAFLPRCTTLNLGANQITTLPINTFALERNNSLDGNRFYSVSAADPPLPAECAMKEEESKKNIKPSQRMCKVVSVNTENSRVQKYSLKFICPSSAKMFAQRLSMQDSWSRSTMLEALQATRSTICTLQAQSGCYDPSLS